MLLDLLFPRRSLLGLPGPFITEEEWAVIRSAVPVVLGKKDLLSQGLTHLDGSIACGDFRTNPLLRKAIHLLKYKRISQVADILGTLLATTFLHSSLAKEQITNNESASTFVLVPLPLHWTRTFRRGFNQCALLAAAVAAQTGLPVMPLLTRRRRTRSQVGLSRRERQQNTSGAFAGNCPAGFPAEVILVDDVMTTGATLDAAAHALKRHGVRKVFALTVAKEQ